MRSFLSPPLIPPAPAAAPALANGGGARPITDDASSVEAVPLTLSVRLNGFRFEFVGHDCFVTSHPCVMTRLDDIGVAGDEVELGTVVMDHVQSS